MTKSATPPHDTRDALARAERHGRRAIAEGLLGIRALIDAASLATTGRPAAAGALEPFWLLAGELAELFAGEAQREGDHDGELLRALADALDEEIARWETRSRDDPEARPVLRAFLGVRELLADLGFLADAPRTGPRPGPRPVGKASPQARARRA